MQKPIILIVSDHTTLAKSTSKMLVALGYDFRIIQGHSDQATSVFETENIQCILYPFLLKDKKEKIHWGQQLSEIYRIPIVFLATQIDLTFLHYFKTFDFPIYLAKPYDKDDLAVNIELAIFNYPYLNRPPKEQAPHLATASTASFLIKKDQVLHRVHYQNILYFKSDHVYVSIHFQGEVKFFIRKSLNALMGQLPSYFFRAHRSYIINLEAISSIQPNSVLLDQKEVPLGKQYRSELIKKIGFL